MFICLSFCSVTVISLSIIFFYCCLLVVYYFLPVVVLLLTKDEKNKQAKVQSFHILIWSLTVYSFVLSMFSCLLFCSIAVLLLSIILYCRSSLVSRVNNFRTLSTSNERGRRKNTTSSCPILHSCHPFCCAFCSVAVLLSLEYLVSKPFPRVTKKGKEKNTTNSNLSK